MIHHLKTLSMFWVKVYDGSKKFEVRKDDRSYNVGDTLDLHEVDNIDGHYTGRILSVIVTYLLRGLPYVQPDYVIMSIDFKEVL
jgi:hypothetical protein